jgi:uncharacterized protein YigE (DUF2233 family)
MQFARHEVAYVRSSDVPILFRATSISLQTNEIQYMRHELERQIRQLCFVQHNSITIPAYIRICIFIDGQRSRSMLNEEIGHANFDVGHVFFDGVVYLSLSFEEPIDIS